MDVKTRAVVIYSQATAQPGRLDVGALGRPRADRRWHGLIAALIRNDCFCALGPTSVDHRSGLRAVTDAELGAERFDGVKGGELMPNKSVETGARVGDWIEPHGVHGQASRRGEIIEVLGGEGHEHYRVRWDEQHESIVYPADGVIVTPGPGRRGRGAGKCRAR